MIRGQPWWHGINDLDDCVMLAIAAVAIAWGFYKLIKGESHMQTASIGYYRDDGDFRLLATLSNIDDELPEGKFKLITENLANVYRRSHEVGQGRHKLDIVILDRQDAPDYIDLEGDDQEQAV